MTHEGKARISESPALRRLHNVRIVQSRKGWTQAEVWQAIKDADAGTTYLFA